MSKLLRRQKAFSGRLIELYLEKRRFPNGYIADLEVIRHPGAVLVVPFLDNNRIILIKQFRPVINSYIWELPAGTLNKKETPLNCAKRELQEETACGASLWQRVGYIFPAPGYTTEKIHIYQARQLKKVASHQEADELIMSKVFSRKAVMRLLDSGSIVDAKTICALKLVHIL